MGVHFYDESPSHPAEQRGRLKPGHCLLAAGIPYVVWAEDALSIVHRVPTGLFDQQLLVPEDKVSDAVRVICENNDFSVTESSSDDTWGDYKLYNPDRPFAFQGTPSILLTHNDTEAPCETTRILVHSVSTFHFDIDDLSRTCLNPDPPDPELGNIRFPTLPALYDALIDTIHEPPLPFIHLKFDLQLHTFLSYLNLYNVSNDGVTKADVDPGDIAVIPACLRVLDAVKDENKPFLTRRFLGVPEFDFPVNALERGLIKEARYKANGLPYCRPPIPYNPLYRSQGKVHPPPTPQLLRELKDLHARHETVYDCIRRRWPSVLRGIRL